MNAPASISFGSLRVGDLLPERQFQPDTVQLMMYNAAIWNGHRIHFDTPYATEVEGYPGLVVPGPLLGDWLHQCITDWMLDAGRLVSIEYSNRIASYLGETLTSGGEVIAVDAGARTATVKVHVRNADGEVITPGEAVVRFHA